MGKIGEVARILINKSLGDLDVLLPSQGGWRTALPENRNITVYQPPSLNNLRDFIHRKLGHLTVNPHDSERTIALRETYKYFEESGRVDKKYVNRNPESADDFVNELITLAKRQSQFVREPDLLADSTDQLIAGKSESLVLLCGQRGCGKTFFLNHLLSKYQEMLDHKHTIWIRINLQEDFGNNQDLPHRIYAQTAKIIMRYYDPAAPDTYQRKDLPIHAQEDLKKFVDEEIQPDPKVRLDYYDRIMSMKQQFTKRDYPEEPLNPNVVDKVLAREIHALGLRQGYSYIVVFDGLDRLESTPSAADKFALHLSNVINYAYSPESTGAAFLAVLRTNSLQDLALVQGKSYMSLYQESREILSVDFNEIMEKRISFLVGRIPSVVERHDWTYDSVFARWPSHLEGFRDWFSAHIGSGPKLNLFGENRRAQMQFVQYLYFRYLRREEEQSRSYLLIESLMMAGNVFATLYHRYRKGANGNIERTSSSERMFDNSFVPSIFTYPHFEWYHGCIKGDVPHKYAFLLGLRVLQLMAAQYRLMRQNPERTPLTVADVQTVCQQLFQYRNDLILRLLEEYHDCELLELRYPTSLPPTSDLRLQVVIMPKGLAILREFIFDIAYLNLAAMRLPLHPSALERHHPFFETFTLDSAVRDKLTEDGRRKNLTRWIACKVTNAIELFRLITASNDAQFSAFHRRRKELTVSVSAKEVVEQALKGGRPESGMFNFILKLQQSIINQLLSINSSFDGEVVPHLQRHFAD